MAVARLGDILDVASSAVDAVGDVASSAVDDVGDVISYVPGASALGDALTSLANGPLKDFANTAVGRVVLTAIGSTFYGSTVWFLGPQLASWAFAIPGLAKGDDFETAWLQGVKTRAEDTAKQFVGPASDDLGNQLNDTISDLIDEYGIGNDIPESVADIAKKYGVPQDVAAQAKALVMHQVPPELGDITPDQIVGDPVTGSLGLTPTPTIQSSLAFALAHGGASGQAIANQVAQQQRVAASIQQTIASSPLSATSALAMLRASPATAPSSAPGAPSIVAAVAAPATASKAWGDIALVGVVGVAAIALVWFYVGEKR